MRIVWTADAIADLDAIHAYIARTSPRYAEIVVNRLVSATSRIAEFPESCREFRNSVTLVSERSSGVLSYCRTRCRMIGLRCSPSFAVRVCFRHKTDKPAFADV